MKRLCYYTMCLALGFLLSCTRASQKADDGDQNPETTASNPDSLSDPDSITTTSSVFASGSLYAGGVEKSTVTVRLFDNDNNPMVGVTPVLTVTGGITLDQTCGPTNDQGVAVCPDAITSTKELEVVVGISSPFELQGNTLNFYEAFSATSKGYDARHCGFDMDGDGNVAEEEDCNVCDGVTTDVDGDSFDEDLFYVDSATGQDNPSCGSPTAPCLTPNYVISNRLDGPSVGQEDIMCISGTFDSTMAIDETLSGKAVTGHFIDGLYYPADPFMIVGWDKDNDGRYPPFDNDDTAVFEGGDGYFLDISGGTGADYIEIAHLTINNYNHATAAGVINANNSVSREIYVHDIESTGINRGKTYSGSEAVFNLYNQALAWTIKNVKFEEAGARYIYLYDTFYQGSGGITIDKNDVQAYGADGDSIWGMIQLAAVDGFGVYRSVFDANISNTTFVPANHQIVGINECSENIKIENNSFLGVHTGLNIYIVLAADCTTARSIDEVLFDRNYFTFSDSTELQAYAGISINDDFHLPQYTVENLYITNNVMDAEFNTPQYFITHNLSVSTMTVPGVTIIAGNTFYGTPVTHGLMITNDTGTDEDDITLTGNLFAANNGPANHIYMNLLPGNYTSSHNVFSAGAAFLIDSTTYNDIAAWDLGTPTANSNDCDPSFQTSVSDLRFVPQVTDTCVVDTGTDLSGIIGSLSVDFRGLTRDTGVNADIGAHQR